MRQRVPFTTVILCSLIAFGVISCGENKSQVTVGAKPGGHFTYVSGDESGVRFSNILSSSEYFNIVEHTGFFDGGSVAVGDINNDGLPDLYFLSNQWDNKLYLNKGDFEFEDITTKAGATGAGNWKTAAVLKDADKDGKLDIYIRGVKGNRYINTEDLLLLNNGDLTFTRSFELFGLDSLDIPSGKIIADINNDGWNDIITTGSFPYDEQVLKSTSLQPANALRINHGNNLFTDIAWYAGVAATDKSWTPVVGDFDNDGRQDLFITNGIVGRVNELGYLKDSARHEDKLKPGPASNFMFRQTEDLKFEDVSDAWIGKAPGFSNGAAAADLDNDGDLDIVVNNINAEAFLMRNDLSDNPAAGNTKATPEPYMLPLLEQIEAIPFKHNENSFNTLTKQPLIPFTNATRGPKTAIADINGDKLDDVFITGGQGQPGVIYIQTKAGKFVQLPQPAFEPDKQCEETCAAFFDVDGDKDMDLLIGNGGEEFLDKRLLLRLFINNGRGTFSKAEGLKRADIVSSLQKIYVNASCIVPGDVDNDGDIDVFVGGGTVTGRYGVDSDSFILLNDGKGMLIENSPSFENRQRPGGMVQTAAWTDFDGDKFPELITAGEWMPITIWKNDSSVLKPTSGNGLDSTFGLWNSMVVDDLDGDGDMDIVAGNFGLNSRIQVRENEPLELVVSDIDKNGKHDPLLFYYNSGRKYPLLLNSPFGTQITTRKVAERKVTMLESAWFENNGKGQFTRHVLPGPAQYYPVFGINITDADNDGRKDIILVGNLRAVQPELGQPDGGYGLVLSGGTKPMSLLKSGFVVKGEGRDVKTLLNFQKEKLFIVTRNNDSLVVFKKR